MTYVPRTPPPLPKGTVVHRHVERRPSPFQEVAQHTDINGTYQWDNERQRIRAQRTAQGILNELDSRRRAIARDEYETGRRERSDKGVPRGARTADILSDATLRQLAKDGYTAAQIARDHGISPRTVRDRAKPLGIKFPHRGGELANPDITADDVAQLREQGKTWDEIAAHFGVSRTSMRRFRRRTSQFTPHPKGKAA